VAGTSKFADNKTFGFLVAKKKVGVQQGAFARGARILNCAHAPLPESLYSALRLSI
jgi:hypothetical protein